MSKSRRESSRARAKMVACPPKVDGCLVLHFDGAVKGNGKKNAVAGYGWVISVDGKIKASGCGAVQGYKGEAPTVNDAEWVGLLKGIGKLVSKKTSKKILIFGDSKLIINQLNGQWKCRDKFAVYRGKAIELLPNKKLWEAKWIPRELNEDADEMSKQGLRVKHGS